MKNEIFFWVQNLKWAIAHLSRRLGAGQALGARGACVGNTGARWARALGARRQARQACLGVGRGAQAGVRGRAGRRRQAWQACVGAGRGAQAGVCGRAGRRRQAAAAREGSGRVGVRGSWAQAQVGGRALGARQGARRAVGRRWVRGARAAWAGLGQCTRCTRPIFDPF